MKIVTKRHSQKSSPPSKKGRLQHTPLTKSCQGIIIPYKKQTHLCQRGAEEIDRFLFFLQNAPRKTKSIMNSEKNNLENTTMTTTDLERVGQPCRSWRWRHHRASFTPRSAAQPFWNLVTVRLLRFGETVELKIIFRSLGGKIHRDARIIPTGEILRIPSKSFESFEILPQSW